jgi:hypothetical protein
MPIICENEARFSIRQQLTQSGRGGCWVERDIGFPRLEDRQNGRHHGRTLVIKQDHSLSCAGGLLDGPGQTIRPAVEVGVGPRCIAALYGKAAGVHRGLLLESIGDRLLDFLLWEAHERTVPSVPNQSA